MKRTSSKPARGISVVALVAALAAGTTACSPDANEPGAIEQEVVEAKTDGDWIRLDGTVVSNTPTSFVLDYGADVITVEVDDWDNYREGISVLPGDRVSVTGRVDENAFSVDTIEASAVYLANLNTVFYASAADEEELGLAAIPTGPVDDGVDYTGWVTGVTNGGFRLGIGPMQISVNTSQLQSPLATTGIQTGDRVYVWGDLDLRADGQSRLDAEGLVELIDASNSKQMTNAAPTATPTEAN